uniref:Uncharacterized protein n=1 Tax=Romanomermis culicivorax TaxID=13658 RepID=A0A915JYM0_ROMCU
LSVGSPSVEKRRFVNKSPTAGEPAASTAVKLPTLTAVPSANAADVDGEAAAASIISRLERELKNDAAKNNYFLPLQEPSTTLSSNLRISDVTNEFPTKQMQSEKPVSVLTSSVPQKFTPPKVERSQHPPIVYVSVDGHKIDQQKVAPNSNTKLYSTYQGNTISNQAPSTDQSMPTIFDANSQTVISPYNDVNTPSPTIAEHLDFVQSDLENMHDMLSSNDFNFDINDLNDIFSNQDQNQLIFDSDQQLEPTIDIPETAIDDTLHNLNQNVNHDDFTSVLDEFIQCPPSLIDDHRPTTENADSATMASVNAPPTPLQTPITSPVRQTAPTIAGITVTNKNVATKNNLNVPATKLTKKRLQYLTYL